MKDPCFAAIETIFTPNNSEHLSMINESHESPTTAEPTFPFETLFDAVIDRKLCQHYNSERWYCIPLHKPESPVLNGQYVVFTDHQLRGKQVVLAAPDDGDKPKAVSPAEFSDYAVVEQLRFWHPEYYQEGIKRVQSVATEALEETEPSEIKSIDNGALDRLARIDAALEYALAVGEDRSRVERSTLDGLQEAIAKRISNLQATRQQRQIKETIEEIEGQIDTGDAKVEDTAYEEAIAAYEGARERLEALRENISDSEKEEDQIGPLAEQLEDKLRTAKLQQERAVVTSIQGTGQTAEEQARTAETEEELLRARSHYNEALQAYERAQDAISVDGELEEEVVTAINRVTDRINAVEAEYYQAEINAELEAASRYERAGDELAAKGTVEDANQAYKTALDHAIAAADLTDETTETSKATTGIQNRVEEKQKTVKTELERQRLQELLDQCEERQQAAAEAVGQSETIEELSDARALLTEAVGIARTTAGIETDEIKAKLDKVSRAYRTQISIQNEQALTADLEPIDERVVSGEEALSDDRYLEAIDQFIDARADYELVRDTLDDRGLAEFDPRIRARVSDVKSRLQEARKSCEQQLKKILGSAESSIEQAKEKEEAEDYEGALTELKQGLNQYQDAYQLAVGLGTDRRAEIQSRFRRAEKEIQSLRTIPAKVAIQDCLDGARDNLRAGHKARNRGYPTNARELYRDAQYLLEEARYILTQHEFGTTSDILRYNDYLLSENIDRVETCIRALEGQVDKTVPTASEIQDVTTHLQPPNTTNVVEERTTDEEVQPVKEPVEETPSEPVETDSADFEIDGVDILEEIEAEYKGLSDKL